MKEKFIVLRSTDTPVTRTRSRGPLPGSLSHSSEKYTVELELTTSKKAKHLATKKDVVSIVPAMPMKLVQPFKGKLPSAKANSTIAWGIEAVGAHTSPFTGSGIKVAVLDTGINAKHPAFKGVKLTQKDFTGEGKTDVNGHGTHCAGTIFGRDVNGIRIGVAVGIKEALIGKVLGEKGGGGSDLIASAINWAIENGANIISMSLGIDFAGYVKELKDKGMPIDLATSKALEGYRANVLLFEKLAGFTHSLGNFNQSSILIAAAGNESRRDKDDDYEIAVSPPAVAEGFISVGALGQVSGDLSVAYFSNTGPLISGPGVDILSADLDKGLTALSGTSMATPHVAGVAALWAEKLAGNGFLNAKQLTANLLASGDIRGLKKGFDPLDVGSGMVQAPQ